jgi:hypothetical protein
VVLPKYCTSIWLQLAKKRGEQVLGNQAQYNGGGLCANVITTSSSISITDSLTATPPSLVPPNMFLVPRKVPPPSSYLTTLLNISFYPLSPTPPLVTTHHSPELEYLFDKRFSVDIATQIQARTFSLERYGVILSQGVCACRRLV